MKRIYLLITSCVALLVGNTASAQIGSSVITFFAPDSINNLTICPGCPTGAYLRTATTGYTNGETAQIDINWGDGNTESNTVTFVQQNYFTPDMATHTYAVAGVYTVIFNFADTHGNVGADTLYVNVSPNCGMVYTGAALDTDNNGTGDVYLHNALFDFTGSNAITTTHTLNYYSGTGNGYVLGLDNTYTPYSVSVNPAWLATNNYILSPSTPSSVSVDLSGCPSLDDMAPFILVCDPANPAAQTDLAINYVYGWGYRAGFQTGFLHINVCNFSCSGSQNADLSITFESLLSVYSHNIPGATITGNTINANLNVNGCTTYTIYFDVPGATPASTPLTFTSSIMPVGVTDFDPSNNTNVYVDQVRNSWDPNDKSVNKPAIISPSVADELTYVIRFQNMGNDDAFNIIVRDTLDADLDLATFELLEFSHNGSVSINPSTRLATFTFPSINLPAASVNEPESHGYAVYRIKEKNALPIGTEINNTAYIYFDFNPPIITNTTSNINQNMGVDELLSDEFAAYPVPASDYLVISSKQNQPMESIRLVDITGKTVLNITNAGATFTLDLQGIASGAYNLVIQSAGSSANKKIMVKK